MAVTWKALAYSSEVTSSVTSEGVVRSTADSSLTLTVSTADSKGVSAGVAASTADSKAVSEGVVRSTADSSLTVTVSTADSKGVSAGVAASTADSKAISEGVVRSTADSSLTLTVSTADSKAVSAATAYFQVLATHNAGTNVQAQGAITITAGDVVVTVNASNPGGVTLPAPVAGARLFIKNATANPFNLYPAAGHNINALAVNIAVSVVAGATVIANARSATLWDTTYEDHETLTGLLGGAATDHYHLTSANASAAVAEPATRSTADSSLTLTVSTADSKGVSAGVAASTADSKAVIADSKAVSAGSIALSYTNSEGVVRSTADSSLTVKPFNQFGAATGAVSFAGQQAQNLVLHTATTSDVILLTPVVGKIAFGTTDLAAYICTVAV